MKPDLTLLYSQVGLRPGCTMEELQLAYRRRISQLQPDPANPHGQSAEESELLRDLIAMYASASGFHRRHGRLPGAAQARGDWGQPDMTRRWQPFATAEHARARRPVHALLHAAWFLAVVALLAALAWWDHLFW